MFRDYKRVVFGIFYSNLDISNSVAAQIMTVIKTILKIMFFYVKLEETFIYLRKETTKLKIFETYILIL